MKKINPKQFWLSIDHIYRHRMESFLALASKHVYNKDHAIDCVHDALAKTQEYLNKHPERKVREMIVRFLILKACKKKNKESREIPSGFMDDNGIQESEWA